MKNKPGYDWWTHVGDGPSSNDNIQKGDGKTVFDELVIDNWLHLEQMDDEHWWMRVGPISIRIKPNLDNYKESDIIIEDDESLQEEYLIRALGDFAKKFCLDEFTRDKDGSKGTI